MQADGSRDLENDVNRGDGGDPYPGYLDNRSFDATSSPASTGYSGQDSLVALTDISDSGDTMTVTVSVHATGGAQSGDVEGRLKDIEARPRLSRTPCHRAPRRCRRSVRAASPARRRAARREYPVRPTASVVTAQSTP